MLRNLKRGTPIGHLVACGILTAVLAGCSKEAPTAKPETAPLPAPAPKSVRMDTVVPAAPLPGTVALPPAVVKNPTSVLESVDGEIFTQGDLDKQSARILESLAGQVDPSRRAMLETRIQHDLLNQFVTHTLLKHAVERQQIGVSDQEVTNAIEKLAARLPEGVTLQAAMEKEGMTTDELASNVVTTLRIQKLLEGEMVGKTNVTEDEVRAFYAKEQSRFEVPENVKARHILIATRETDDAKAREEKKARAEALRAQLAGGADFAELAKNHSDCPSKAQGGDLGSFTRGQMVKPFEDAAFTQATNTIGPVVETEFGYHVIEVMEHNPAQTMSYEDTRDRIEAVLKQRKQRDVFAGYLETLRQAAKIEYAPEVAALMQQAPVPQEAAGGPADAP